MLFPTQASTHAASSDVIDFYRDVARFGEFRLLETVMRYRTAYQKWRGTGEAVPEQKDVDPKAVAELEQLYREVFND
jgi:chromosome partitioning protein